MAKPFLKWAGGKTQLLSDIDDKLSGIRTESDTFIYVEPFLGGGSVLFHALEKYPNIEIAIVNDLNKELINCYRVIANEKYYPIFKESVRSLQEEYNKSHHKEDFYKDIREKYNNWMLSWDSVSLDIDGAVWFLFLNKCGFNGLYRVSKKSGYNVPWGQKSYLNMYDEDNLDACHFTLNKKVVFMTGDYRATRTAIDIANVKNLDFVYYLDPPYKPVSKTAAFTSYTTDGFTDKQQEQLKEFCDEIHNNNGYFLMSNSSVDDYFENLYRDYNVSIVKAKRNINSDGNKRGEVDEVLILNYECTYVNKEIPLF